MSKSTFVKLFASFWILLIIDHLIEQPMADKVIVELREIIWILYLVFSNHGSRYLLLSYYYTVQLSKQTSWEGSVWCFFKGSLVWVFIFFWFTEFGMDEDTIYAAGRFCAWTAYAQIIGFLGFLMVIADVSPFKITSKSRYPYRWSNLIFFCFLGSYVLIFTGVFSIPTSLCIYLFFTLLMLW